MSQAKAAVFRPRTHRLWSILGSTNIPTSLRDALPRKVFSAADLDHLRSVAPPDSAGAAHLLKLAEAETWITPQIDAAITQFDEAVRNEGSHLRNEDLKGLEETLEPDWVGLKQYFGKEIDIDFLHDKYVEPEGVSEEERARARQDSQESVQLLKWFKQVAEEIEQQERDRLKAELQEELQSAEDSEEEQLIKNYYNALLGRVGNDTKRKLKILAAIGTAQPSVQLGDAAGLPPLPNREKLKDWYEVDLIDSYFDESQRQQLTRYHEVVPRELRRLSLFPNPKDHLQKTLDYEVDKAGSNSEAAAKAREAYSLKFDAYSEWESTTFTPESSAIRFNDAVAIKFLKSKGVKVPSTRRELYQELEDLDKNEWSQFLRNETFKRTVTLTQEYRKRHPEGAVNAAFNNADEAAEIFYDNAEAVSHYIDRILATIETRKAQANKELEHLEELHVEEVLAQHPEWEAEIQKNIKSHRWDHDISAAEYEKDIAKTEAMKKIWWTKDDHHAH